MKRICVFCGSSPGTKPIFTLAAREMANELASRHIGLVYGGGILGMMGEIADTVVLNGGEVTGVITQALADKQVANSRISDLRIVQSMHERKALMVELSDAFIALPGGLGTFEEFFEVLTWAQLGLHRKPCGVLDVNGFYEPMIEFLDDVVDNGFIAPEVRNMILVDITPEGLLGQFENYHAPKVDKAAWARRMSKR